MPKDMQEQTEKPPLFSRWSSWYLLVLLFLLLQIVLFSWLTNYFS